MTKKTSRTKKSVAGPASVQPSARPQPAPDAETIIVTRKTEPETVVVTSARSQGQAPAPHETPED